MASRVEHPVIGPGHTFATVTDKISSLVLTTKTPIGWFVGFGIAFLLFQLFLGTVTLLLAKGTADLGRQRPGGLGLRHHQLRVVDRDRPRGDADLRDPAPLPAAVAHLDQPLRGGDDPLRGRVRGHVPDPAHGPPVGGRLLADALPEHDGPVAQLPQPPHLGRVRGLDLRHRLRPLLVRGAPPRPRHPARPGAEQGREDDLRDAGPGLARLGAALGQLRDGLPHPRRALHPARRLRAHRGELRLRGRGHPRLARHGLPALLRGRRHLRRLRHGADPRHPAAQGVRARGLHHHEAHREHGEGDARDLPRGGLRVPDRGLHGLVQREHVRALHDVEPGDRALRLDVLGAHPLQRGRHQHAVVEAAAHEPPVPLLRLAGGQRRDVARAVRDHRHQPAPRLPALLLGQLPRDAVRLDHVPRARSGSSSRCSSSSSASSR